MAATNLLKINETKENIARYLNEENGYFVVKAKRKFVGFFLKESDVTFDKIAKMAYVTINFVLGIQQKISRQVSPGLLFKGVFLFHFGQQLTLFIHGVFNFSGDSNLLLVGLLVFLQMITIFVLIWWVFHFFGRPR